MTTLRQFVTNFTLNKMRSKSLDMSINVNKSSCIPIGPRYNVKCKPLSTSQGGEVVWASCTPRFLGVYTGALRSFSCSFIIIKKKPFYRAFNRIYGKTGRVVPELEIMELLKFKCLPCLLIWLRSLSGEQIVNEIVRICFKWCH